MISLYELLFAMQTFVSTFGQILNFGYAINIFGEPFYLSLWTLITPATIVVVLVLKIIKLIPGA